MGKIKIMENRIIRESIAVVFLFMSIFLLISLISYSPSDPSLNSFSSSGIIRNWGGLVGSYLSDLLYQIFGYSSFIFVIILFVSSILLFRNIFSFSKWRFFGYCLLIISLCIIFSLLFPEGAAIIWDGDGGGMLGKIFSSLLMGYFSRSGALVVIGMLLVLSMLISFELNYAELIIRAKNMIMMKKGKGATYEIKPLKGEGREITINRQGYTAEGELTKKAPIRVHKHRLKGEVLQEEFPFPRYEGSFELPPVSILDMPEVREGGPDNKELIEKASLLERKLMDFGIEGKVLEIKPGPVITIFEFEPAPGVKLSRILSLSDDLSLALKAERVRIVAPIPGKSVIGIEIPNPTRQKVFMREIALSSVFQRDPSKLLFCMGKDVEGNPVVADITKMPHLLIAGVTGSGKSVFLNSIIVSILLRATPLDVKFILVDPKRLELIHYDGIPHLLYHVITDPKEASLVLKGMIKEMERRYSILAEVGVKNIEAYNKRIETISEGSEDKRLPYIIIIIDELSDLMIVAARDIEDSIIRLAQMARAAGIHLIVATQRPSVDVITGIIKANFPARISFQVASRIDSRTILDHGGAENLLGNGDMLFNPPGTSKLIRIHGVYISEGEISRIAEFWRTQSSPQYMEDLVIEMGDEEDTDDAYEDELYHEAVNLVKELRYVSISMIQRRLRVGYNRAARMVERMEKEGIVGPQEGSKPREVLIDKR